MATELSAYGEAMPGPDATASWQCELDSRAAQQIAGSALSAHKTLDIVDGAFWVGRRLILRGLADEAVRVGEGDVRRSDTVA